MRRGLRNSDQKPNRNRSSAEKFGARRRERLMIRSCCFMRRLSATMALAPPGLRSLAIVVNRCARSISRFFMDVKGRGGCVHEQDSQTWQFQVIITNSPHTGRKRQELLCRNTECVMSGFFDAFAAEKSRNVCSREKWHRARSHQQTAFTCGAVDNSSVRNDPSCLDTRRTIFS